MVLQRRINRKKFWSKIRAQYVLVLLAVIIALYLLVFKYLPIFGWAMGFMDFKIGVGSGKNFLSPWVGFKNFGTLFRDVYFWISLKNTLIISVMRIVFSFLSGIFVAVFINEIRLSACKKTVQTISYLPHFVSWVVVASLARTVLGADGAVNGLLMALGMSEPYLFMENPSFFYPLTTVTYVWKEAGWDAIIYIAAITGIDAAQYEAATIDGAGRLKRIAYITIPNIIPTVVILLVLQVGQVLNTGYEQMFLLQTGPTSTVAEVIDLYIYRVAFGGSGRYSLATVASIFKSVVSIVLVFAANKAANRFGRGITI